MPGRRGGAALAALALLLVGFGPLGPCSGGALSGEVRSGPAGGWSFTADVTQIQLETNPDEPHSVNTWCVGLGDRLYVPTSMIRGPKSPAERVWVKNVTNDARVRVRVGDAVYERVAVRVEDHVELETARAALERKYELDPGARDPEREVWIYRLDPRAP
jgi:hypothetical protein